MTNQTETVGKYEGTWAGRPRKVDEGILFSFYSPGAAEVLISGDFNGWKHDAGRMIKGRDDVWRIIFGLRPGRSYDYKYIVDGGWITDPNNPDLNPDTAGGANSVIYVGENGELLSDGDPERRRFTLEGRQIGHTYFDSSRYQRRFDLYYVLPPNYDDGEPPPVIICLNNYIKSQEIDKHCRRNRYLGIMPSPELGGDFIRKGKLNIFIELLGFMRQKFTFDESRIYVTGMSNGGLEAFLVSMYYPDLIAAAAFVFGPYRLGHYKDAVNDLNGDEIVRFIENLDFPHRMVLNLKNLPIYISHGGADEAVPADDAIALKTMLEKTGGAVKFNFYPDRGHTWMMVDDDLPGVFEWFGKFRLDKYPASFYYTAPFGVFKNSIYWAEFMPYELTRPVKLKASVEGGKKLRAVSDNIKKIVFRPSRELLDTALRPAVESGSKPSLIETDKDSNAITVTF